ncbi:hypothetical protein BLD25_04425 [Candidatus Gracilibacteria bacterium GN02-872]|nr:hypothetical protein BLD25_04425 [Candidatus Gracilibacteria bacterium GN02-872]
MGDELQKIIPDAKTELKYGNDFQLLIAIIMSAQSTDKQVNKVNEIFFKKLIEPKDGVELGVDKIRKYINSISFFNNKAKNIFGTCEKLVEAKNKIPESVEELQKLPGVGVKTSKVFLSVTKDAPYLGVDTHVHRVLNRFGIVKTNSPLETDKIVSKIEMDLSYKNLHNTLILFGRYYSKAGDDDFSKGKDPEFCKNLKKKLDKVK